MMPIAEYGKGEGHEYGEPCPQYDNQVAYGRGYVQLTWDYNYEKADSECALYDLENPADFYGSYAAARVG